MEPDGRDAGSSEPRRPRRKKDIAPATFFDVDLRVGRVVSVDDFPEARKAAWKLTVDFGPTVGTLQTSAQIKTYSKEQLVDRLVVGAINLGPKRIAGFTSEFLVLGGINRQGVVRLLNVDEGAEPGDPVA